MEKTYDIRPALLDDERGLLAEHNDLLAHLLYHRGVRGSDEARAFVSPNYDTHRHDPFLMKDMDKAVDRIAKAIEEKEHIVVFSDYDADGGPGGVVLHDLLKKVGHTNFENYIPDRHGEGFGLNETAIDEFATRKTKLIITVDCGITDAFELNAATAHGIDVIVTDHHTPPEELPKAYAILDPKQVDCAYPFKELCGAGVAFKLTEGFIARHGEKFGIQKGWEKWLLDLVGIATLSDMVSLTGENRVFASYGLTVLRKTRRPGLLKLFSRMRMYRNGISEDDITFMVTPRINAASRLGKAEDAFRLLATDDDAEAGMLAEKLDKINDERKGIVAALVKELKHVAKERVEGKRVLVIGNPDWRPSLLGLAANSLVEEYNMPVFLWGRDGSDCIKGSCRGPEGVNVVSLMRVAAKEGVLDDFGGHHEAGGFRVAEGKVHLLPESLEKAYEAVMFEPQSEPKNFVDQILSIEDVTMQTYRTVASLAPFGVGNEKPIFLFKSVPIASVRVFGKQNNHLEISFQKFDDTFLKAIGFFTKPDSYGALLEAGKVIDLVASFELSNFNGRSELRLRIVDIV